MWLEYIFLGIVQGIFEWIPISSEGVVALFSQVLIKGINPVDIALFLHLGTLLAVLFYFRKEWKDIILLKNIKLVRFLIISFIISLIIGYPLYKLIRNILVGNILLLVTGFGLLITAYFHRANKRLEISFNKLGVITGFLQGLSVIPGLSRSGSTIFGLSLSNLSPSEVLKISYIMSVPVVLASSIYLLLSDSIIISNAWISLVSAFIIGIISLHLLMNLVKKVNFFKFALVFSFLCFLGVIIGIWI